MSPWLTEIMDSFQRTKPDLEPEFTPAAYNKLLNTLFPVNTPYAVFPQVHRCRDFQNSSALATFAVYYNSEPIFLLDLHSYADLPRISSREAADGLIRAHIRDMLPFCPLKSLNAVVAFGTRLCFYTAASKNPILPLHGTLEENNWEDTRAPVDWWDCDVLDDDGAIRLKEVVNKIRNQCENLES